MSMKQVAVASRARGDNCLEFALLSLEQISIGKSEGQFFAQLMSRAGSTTVPVWDINQFNAVVSANPSK